MATCPICLEEPVEPVTFKPCVRCLKVYCKSCLETHVKDYSSNCPTCKSIVRITKRTVLFGDATAALALAAQSSTTEAEEQAALKRRREAAMCHKVQ